MENTNIGNCTRPFEQIVLLIQHNLIELTHSFEQYTHGPPSRVSLCLLHANNKCDLAHTSRGSRNFLQDECVWVGGPGPTDTNNPDNFFFLDLKLLYRGCQVRYFE